jgi:hypothetical protein
MSAANGSTRSIRYIYGQTMRQHVSIVLLTALVAAAVPAGAQSLADVARKEEERRKTIPQPAKVYTNKDLTPAPPPSTPPPAAAPASADANATKTDASKTADAAAKDKEKTAEAAAKEPAKDKSYWAGRLKTLQEQLDRNRTYADALQSRINALTADFVNRDDPAQRGVIERDRQKAIAELDRLKRTIQDDQKALADFSEEARRAGVPPGWLR